MHYDCKNIFISHTVISFHWPWTVFFSSKVLPFDYYLFVVLFFSSLFCCSLLDYQQEFHQKEEETKSNKRKKSTGEMSFKMLNWKHRNVICGTILLPLHFWIGCFYYCSPFPPLLCQCWEIGSPSSLILFATSSSFWVSSIQFDSTKSSSFMGSTTTLSSIMTRSKENTLLVLSPRFSVS